MKCLFAEECKQYYAGNDMCFLDAEDKWEICQEYRQRTLPTLEIYEQMEQGACIDEIIMGGR